MFDFLIKFLLVVRSRLKTRARLEAEILVLRQQVVVLIRRESLDHLVVFGEAHLRDVLKTYALYYNKVRAASLPG